MTDHDSGATDKAEEVGAAGAAAPNVVPFPRSWYGSVDELVPIEPQPPRRDRAVDSVSDASAFWGGDTDQGRLVDDDATAARPAKTSPPQQVAREWHEDEVSDPFPPLRGPAVRPRERSSRRVPAALALALVALLAGVISLAALSRGASPRHPAATSASRQPDHTVHHTIPQITTVVQTVTTNSGETVRRRRRRRHEPQRTEGTKRTATTPGSSGSQPRVATRPRTAATTPVNTYHPSAPPASSGSSGYDPPVSGGTPATSGSSKKGCAPSMTNGGACSL